MEDSIPDFAATRASTFSRKQLFQFWRVSLKDDVKGKRYGRIFVYIPKNEADKKKVESRGKGWGM